MTLTQTFNLANDSSRPSQNLFRLLSWWICSCVF